jgi:hypothetical protein
MCNVWPHFRNIADIRILVEGSEKVVTSALPQLSGLSEKVDNFKDMLQSLEVTKILLTKLIHSRV